MCTRPLSIAVALGAAIYGPASRTLRGDVTTRSGLNRPPVRRTWPLPTGSIDPTTSAAQFAVRFVGP